MLYDRRINDESTWGATDDVNVADNDGRTPFFSGAYDGNLRMLKILCEQGADLSMKDKSGLTVPEFALGRKEFNAAKFLSGQLKMEINSCSAGPGISSPPIEK